MYVQVLECGIIKSTIISEVFVPIPDPSVTIANERTENYEFTSIIAVPPSFNAVGSGKNILKMFITTFCVVIVI